MGKPKKPKVPELVPVAEKVDVSGQAEVDADARKRKSGATSAWLTKGQTLGGGTQLK